MEAKEKIEEKEKICMEMCQWVMDHLGEVLTLPYATQEQVGAMAFLGGLMKVALAPNHPPYEGGDMALAEAGGKLEKVFPKPRPKVVEEILACARAGVANWPVEHGSSMAMEWAMEASLQRMFS